MKVCTSCQVEKPESMFHRDSRAKTGYRADCKSCRKIYTQRYNESNREAIKARQRAYHERPDVKDRHIRWCREYYQRNKAAFYERNRKWERDNAERVRAAKRVYQRESNLDPVKAEKHRMRSRLAMAIRAKQFDKKEKTESMLGCTWSHFIKHIESQFLPGMSWDNRSEWHIDHIVPLCSAKTVQDLQRLAHYTNTRPLWSFDNLRKGSSLGHGTDTATA